MLALCLAQVAGRVPVIATCSHYSTQIAAARSKKSRSHRRTEAVAAYNRILPLIIFENRQCGLRATKTVMMEGGVIKSDAVRHPLEALHPATRAGLLELAREAAPLALRWGR